MHQHSLEHNPPSDRVDVPGRPRPKGDVPADRACLSCGEIFRSDGWHNRLCPRCRKRSDSGGL
jgi:hypothetical protein